LKVKILHNGIYGIDLELKLLFKLQKNQLKKDQKDRTKRCRLEENTVRGVRDLDLSVYSRDCCQKFYQ
jgi:hypothetical protein